MQTLLLFLLIAQLQEMLCHEMLLTVDTVHFKTLDSSDWGEKVYLSGCVTQLPSKKPCLVSNGFVQAKYDHFPTLILPLKDINVGKPGFELLLRVHTVEDDIVSIRRNYVLEDFERPVEAIQKDSHCWFAVHMEVFENPFRSIKSSEVLSRVKDSTRTHGRSYPQHIQDVLEDWITDSDTPTMLIILIFYVLFSLLAVLIICIRKMFQRDQKSCSAYTNTIEIIKRENILENDFDSISYPTDTIV